MLPDIAFIVKLFQCQNALVSSFLQPAAGRSPVPYDGLSRCVAWKGCDVLPCAPIEIHVWPDADFRHSSVGEFAHGAYRLTARVRAPNVDLAQRACLSSFMHTENRTRS